MKRKYIIILFLSILIVGILAFSSCISKDTRSIIIDFATLITTVIGFSIALNQLKISSDDYFSKINKAKEDFLDLTVDIIKQENSIKVKTQIFNKSGENKSIQYALLVISEQGNNFIHQLNQLNSELQIESTNDLLKLKGNDSEINSVDLSIIPLTFYYLENIGIANESPSYSHILNTSNLNANKNYSVRFFIFPDNKGYHRSTVDSFKL